MTPAASLLALALAVGGAGAAGPVPHPEVLAITDARNLAAEHAFIQGLLRTKVAERCQRLPEPMKSRARTALAQWRERNQALVNPAFFWVNYVGTATTTSEDESQDYVYRMLTSFDAKAKALAKESLPGRRKPPLAACEAWMAKFDDRALDLEASAHGASLQEIHDYSLRYRAAPAE